MLVHQVGMAYILLVRVELGWMLFLGVQVAHVQVAGACTCNLAVVVAASRYLKEHVGHVKAVAVVVMKAVHMDVAVLAAGLPAMPAEERLAEADIHPAVARMGSHSLEVDWER